MLSRLHSRRVAPALLALTVASTTGCNSLLDVDSPGRVPVDALADPALIPTLSAAAIQTFQCGVNAFAATGGMLSGEYWSSNGFVNNHPWEWRGVVEIKGAPGSCATTRLSTFMGFYTPLQQARFQLDDTFTRADAFTDAEVPNRGRILTEMRAYGGYAYLLLAEGMCSMAIDRGPEITRAEVLAIAEERFTDAIARATAINDASLLNMARVGRARTRLDLGNLTGAAEDAILVPSGFVRNAEFSEAVQARENRFYNLTVRNDFLSVAPAYQNLTVNGVPDPRVRAQDMGRLGADNATRMWRQLKYTASTSNQPIASWAEAQLIYAEAVGGQAGLDAINRVRASNNPAIAPVAGPPPAGSEFTALVLEERRRQLFSEGQRYADMLRHNLPFTTGVNRKGQTISNLTCVPLPDVETRNNPNFSS
jgi:hypothetical protein